MEGTIVNTLAVLVGGTVGVALGRRIPDLMRETVMMGVGLVVLVIGIQMALQTRDFIGVIVSLVLGGVLGSCSGSRPGSKRWDDGPSARSRQDASPSPGRLLPHS